MPRIAEEEERAERIALEKRIKSFAIRNLSYREAFKAVGRDTLAVVLSVALLLGLKDFTRSSSRGKISKPLGGTI